MPHSIAAKWIFGNRSITPEAHRFAIGSMVHYAMARHVLGARNFPPAEEVIVDQFVELILGGLEQRPEAGRITKGKQK